MSKNHTNLFRDLETAKDIFKDARADQKQIIQELETRAKAAVINEKLYEHPVIQDLVETLSGVVNQINYRLQNEDSTKLPDTQRDKLFDQKELYTKMIHIFIELPKKTEDISSQVDAIVKANKK